LGRTEEESSLTRVTVVLFTTRVPDGFSDKLTRQGFEVYEAMAISEVLALAEQHSTSSIIITSDVDEARATGNPAALSDCAPMEKICHPNIYLN
jgi:hypothetical protein